MNGIIYSIFKVVSFFAGIFKVGSVLTQSLLYGQGGEEP